jgi:hypothetical protein
MLKVAMRREKAIPLIRATLICDLLYTLIQSLPIRCDLEERCTSSQQRCIPIALVYDYPFRRQFFPCDMELVDSFGTYSSLPVWAWTVEWVYFPPSLRKAHDLLDAPAVTSMTSPRF